MLWCILSFSAAAIVSVNSHHKPFVIHHYKLFDLLLKLKKKKDVSIFIMAQV